MTGFIHFQRWQTLPLTIVVILGFNYISLEDGARKSSPVLLHKHPPERWDERIRETKTYWNSLPWIPSSPPPIRPPSPPRQSWRCLGLHLQHDQHHHLLPGGAPDLNLGPRRMVLVQGDGLDGTAPHHNLHLFILFELFLCHLPTPVVDSHHALLLLNLPDVIALDDDSRDSHLPGKPLLCWISFIGWMDFCSRYLWFV